MIISERFSLNSLSKGSNPDPKGLLFVNDSGITDLTGVNVVGASVDTVRQIFFGKLSAVFLKKLDHYITAGEEFVHIANRFISGGCDRWHFSKMGKAGGYRYKFQNNDVGLVILVGNYYEKLDYAGSHLKIELSPHFISTRSPAQIWEYLHDDFVGLSRIFLDDPEPKGVSVHLACDYQGFNLPSDFVRKLITKSRTIRAFDGLASIDLSDFSEAVATYGGTDQGRNYLIGKPSAIQLSLYDKSLEMVKSDKVDHFKSEWGIYSLGTYDETKTVRRVEARLHHTVVREIGLGLGLDFEGFNQIVDYLTDIWRFALERNRLAYQELVDHHTERALLHPFWQLLLEDVFFYVPSHKGIKITRKKKEAVDPIARNISSVVGNLISILARREYVTYQFVMQQLADMAVFREIEMYYCSRGKTLIDLEELVKTGLERRRLLGKAA